MLFAGVECSKWADIDVPLLDENGNPVLHKIGDPYVDIAIEIGFAPTKEEYEELNQLKDDLFQAKFRGWDDRVASLTQKIETLEALYKCLFQQDKFYPL